MAKGWGSGFLGVLIFSWSLPATRMAVSIIDPLFLTVARAALAGLLAAALLLVVGARRPSRGDVLPIALVSLGVVAGFPLLTALVPRHVTSAHAITFIGLLPLATAVFGVLRGGERPRPGFWAFSILGSGATAGFALFAAGSGGVAGDLMMLAAIVTCGIGYAEGGRLARHLGGWQVISWALVMALPLMLLLSVLNLSQDWQGVSAPPLAALAYVSVFSMLVGFVFWYKGLAEGGIAAVGQLQLLQPFLSFGFAALLLGEAISVPMIAAASVVALSVAGSRRFG